MDFPLDRAFLWMVAACGATLALLPLCIRIGVRLGMVDQPGRDGRRVHGRAIPRAGGLAIAAVFLPLSAVIGLRWIVDPWFILGYLILVAVGIVDDRRGVRPLLKFTAQILAMGMAVVGAGLVVPAIPLLFDGANIDVFWLRCCISVFVGVGLINAMNLIDGLDGLAAGISAVSAGSIALLGALVGDVGLCLVAVIFGGCLIAILSVNTHPARVFLGDTGSMLLGYLLSCLGMAIVSGDHDHARVSVFLPLLLLVIPWADCLWVMFARLLERRDPFDGDRTHVHHQVLGLGVRHRYTVLLLVFIDAIIAGLAVALRGAGDAVIVACTLACIVLVLGGVRWLTRDLSTRHLYRKPARWTRWYERQRQRTPLPVLRPAEAVAHRLARFTLLFSFCSFHALCALSAERPSGFLGSGAAGLLLLLSAGLLILRQIDHHFVFFLTYASSSYLAVAASLWLPWEQSRAVDYSARIIILLGFASAAALLRLERALSQFVSTPLELLALVVGICVIVIANHHYFFNSLWAASCSIALFLMLKAFSVTAPHRARAAVIAVVASSLAIFIAVQWWTGALLTPFAGH